MLTAKPHASRLDASREVCDKSFTKERALIALLIFTFTVGSEFVGPESRVVQDMTVHIARDLDLDTAGVLHVPCD